jgi:hypothetical protein
MSYEASQLSPHMGTRSSHREVFVHPPSYGPAETSWDAKFWRSLFQRSQEPSRANPGFMNWGTVFGLTITVLIGASFWTGIGLLVARLWK